MINVPARMKLMPDYECWCLWDCVDVGNIDPDLLPISDSLKSALSAWEQEYDSTLNCEDPRESGFATVAELTAFNDEGLRLLERLRTELKGTSFSYFDQLTGQLIEG